MFILPLIIILILAALNIGTAKIIALLFVGYIVFMISWMVSKSLNFRDFRD